MRETSMTAQDKLFLKLGKLIQKNIKTPSEWRRFKRYADFYYKPLPGFHDK